MERIEKTVFISYRRTNVPWALAIFQNLTQHGYDVFFDYSGIAGGDFEQIILGNITARAHFLVLLTPSALERCGEPGDWLRREIEMALDSRRNIVPLMLEGFNFGSPTIASQLTGKMASLKQYNGHSIPPEYFLEAMTRLRDRFLNVALTSVLHPASPYAQVAATEQKAVADAAPLVQERELTAQQWFERGFDATDSNEKLRFYGQAIRLNPEYAQAFYNRGIVHKDKGELTDAINDYTNAIGLKTDFFNAFINRAIALVDKNDPESAIMDCNEAIRLNPIIANAYNVRGSAHYDMGEFEKAQEDFTEAIRLGPDFEWAFHNRGNANLARRDIDSALEDYNEAIRLKSDFSEAISNRGAARHHKGDLEGALKDYNEAIRIEPDSAITFYNRGLTRDAMGDSEGARKDLDEAARLGYKPKTQTQDPAEDPSPARPSLWKA